MGRTKQSNTAIFDAGPIIHLDELACLDLISDFEENLIPDTVWQEILSYRPTALEKTHLNLTHLERSYHPGKQLDTMCRLFSLDAGEIEALSLMAEKPNAVFFTDDAAARFVAEQIGFSVHGTIGILIRSIRREMRRPEQVLLILDQIPLKSTLYIKRSLLEKVKTEVRLKFQL
ncbi:MAG: DNA-binding protein [Deltaproteobacteria bacterium]|nr:DNA-binding protein [Deltaproteobacteria bacterium]